MTSRQSRGHRTDLRGRLLGHAWCVMAVCLALAGALRAAPPLDPPTVPEAPAAIVVDDSPVTLARTMQHDAALADVSFIDRSTGWAVGERGVIWHTSDGGRSWLLQSSGVACRLNSVSFVDERQGWAAGGFTQPHSHAERGILLATDDGGATWKQSSQSAAGTLPTIARIKFFDAERGVAIGSGSASQPSGLLVTRDGGQTWQPLPADAPGQWLTGDFTDLDTGVVAGPAGRYATLVRRRIVHSPSAMITARSYRALQLAPPTGGWLVGDGGLVMTTRDLGHTWQTPPGDLPQFVSEHFDFHALAVAGPNVWIAGSPGTRVFHSPDGGQTWQPQPTGQTIPLRALTFVDAATGWAVGELGTILATADGGRSWHVQRQGGRRAALVALFARETDVPLELLARCGAEDGYLAAVAILHPATHAVDRTLGAPLAAPRIREALTLAGATSATSAWRFPLPPADLAHSPADLLVELNRANDGRALGRLHNYLAGQLRMWRPDVVVTHDPAGGSRDPYAALLPRLVEESIAAAADPGQFTELSTHVGLSAWQVNKLYGLLPPESQADARIATSQFAPRLGRTLAEWADPARRLIHANHTPAPESVELSWINRDAGPPADVHGNLFRGISIPPGSDARRPLAHLPDGDVDELRRLAARRRQMQALVDRTAGNVAWDGQVANFLDGLDADSAGELIYRLAEGYRATGRLDLAADTFTLLARRWPEHPLSEPALTWLVQFYASSETAIQLSGAAADDVRSPRRPDDQHGVRQASAIDMPHTDATPVVGLSRDDRRRRAALLGEYLEAARPALYREPGIRLPLVAVERQLGYANPAKRYFLSLRSLPENDPWRRCAETEEWLVQSDGLPPPKPLGHCRRTNDRPNLDGRLDEPFWRTADRLRLSGKTPATDANTSAELRILYDAEFLYLAVHCPKAAGGNYSPNDNPRPRDADLTPHDRVALRLDVDRDYATAFELTVDHRGWTRDACWGNADWNPAWYVAAASDDVSWTVEAAIPFAELVAEPPSSRDVWAVAVRRTIPRVGYESWAAGNASADDSPDQFGLLIFE